MSDRARSFVDWIKIYALPISVVILGLCLSVGLFYWLRSGRDHQIRQRFSELARSQVENLDGKIDSYSSILQLVTDFYHSIEDINRYKYQSLVNGVLKRHEEISSIQWLPTVASDERTDYLDSLREEGFDKARITTLTPKGDTIVDQSRERYYPITYVEPTLPGQKSSLIGLDYLSDPSRHSLLKRTAEGNLTSVLLNSPSSKTMSTQATSDPAKRVFTLIKPVYEGEHMFMRDRWQNLGGFVALEVPHRTLMETVFPPKETKNMELFVFGDTSGTGQQLLYTEKQPDATTIEGVTNWWTYRYKITIGDKSITVLFNPSEVYLSERRTAYPWVVLLLGIGVTFLLGRGSYRLSGEYLSQEKQFYSIFDNAPYAIATLDGDAKVRLWNDSARTMFGYSESEARGKPLSELVRTGDDDQEAAESIDTLLEETSDEEDFRELEAEDRDGDVFPINLGIREWELQGRTFYTLMAEDITERKKYQRKIERMARRDNLTDLLNRGTFMEKLNEEFERVERYEQDLSILMMDLDFFKDINDTHGHLVGDEILKGVADTLKANTRETDFPARYGGEEFCVALPETGLEKGRELAERLRKKIRDAEYSEGVQVTCSLGVAQWDPNVEDLDDLLNRADEALYQSKEHGRDQTSVWEGE